MVEQKLYTVLLEIGQLREGVHGLHAEIAADDTARYLSRLDAFEREALRLLDGLELRRSVVHH